MSTFEAIKNHSWSIPIDKLMQWRGAWVKHGVHSNLMLIIHYDQLLIRSNENLIESLSLNGKIKGFFKNDILILILNDLKQGIRKIKFQLKVDAAQYIEKLNLYFPVLKHKYVFKGNTIHSRFCKVEDILKHAIEENDTCSSCAMPPNFSTFVKLCLLDPNFPQIVNETQKIIDNIRLAK